MSEGLLDRLLWVVEHRADGNQRELSRRSGLGPNHIGTTLTRLRRNPDADIESDTLAAIARGGGVSHRWLATGEGSADAVEVDAADSNEPRYGSLPGWMQIEAKLMKSSEIPRWAFEKARKMRGLTAPDPLTDEFVESAALHAWRGTSAAEAIAIERARADAQVKAQRTRAANDMKRRARPSNDAPLKLEPPPKRGRRGK